MPRWRYRAEHGANDQHPAVGWLPDGHWWVASPANLGWVYADERDAWALAERLRAQPRGGPGTLVETIAEYEPGVLPPRAAAGSPLPIR